MKRIAVILAVGGLLIGLTAFLSPRIAARLSPAVPSEAATPPEIVDVPLPTIQPAVVTPDIPTFVTFISALPDPAIKGPQLQVFDPSRSKWTVIAPLLDKGRPPDSVKNDRVFTLRLRFLSSSSTTQISLSKGQHLTLKAVVSNTPQLRIAAHKNGQRGLIFSPTFSVPAAAPVAIAIGPATAPLHVLVPQTIDSVNEHDPSDVVLTKLGDDGYQMKVYVKPNSSSWPLDQWILACYFESGCNALPSLTDPQTIQARVPGVVIAPIVVGPLSGLSLAIPDDGGTLHALFLNDPTQQRVIVFEIYPLYPGQDTNLNDNTPEFLSIVESLRP
jgi:hypothetical protein